MSIGLQSPKADTFSARNKSIAARTKKYKSPYITLIIANGNSLKPGRRRYVLTIENPLGGQLISERVLSLKTSILWHRLDINFSEKVSLLLC